MIGTLTLEMLKAMPPKTMFASGTAFDKKGELWMSGSGKLLRWVAVRGEVWDWTIYCHFAENDEEWICRHGDKVFGDEHIRRLVKCDDEAFKMYRF
ncbi:MAG: hypothetical protein WC208_10370 [Gallionella sp.]